MKSLGQCLEKWPDCECESCKQIRRETQKEIANYEGRIEMERRKVSSEARLK